MDELAHQQCKRDGYHSTEKNNIFCTYCRLVERNEDSVEAAQLHGLVNALRSVPAPYQGHSEEIAKGPVRMNTGSRNKASQLCGSSQFQIFLINNENIAIGKQKKEGESTRKFESLQGMSQRCDGRGGKHRNEGEDDDIGFKGDKGCKPNTGHADPYWTRLNQFSSAVSERQRQPEKEGEGVCRGESF